MSDNSSDVASHKIALTQYTITIPAPLWIPPRKGYEGTRAIRAPIALRTAPREKELIEAAAKKRGLTMAMFIRWCAVHVAYAVMNGKPNSGEVYYDPALSDRAGNPPGSSG